MKIADLTLFCIQRSFLIIVFDFRVSTALGRDVVVNDAYGYTVRCRVQVTLFAAFAISLVLVVIIPVLP